MNNEFPFLNTRLFIAGLLVFIFGILYEDLFIQCLGIAILIIIFLRPYNDRIKSYVRKAFGGA